MTYKCEGDRVTLEMSRLDYATLLLAVGYKAGACADDKPRLYGWLDFVNRMNTGNPEYTPYEIPPEFLTKQEAPNGPR